MAVDLLLNAGVLEELLAVGVVRHFFIKLVVSGLLWLGHVVDDALGVGEVARLVAWLEQP